MTKITRDDGKNFIIPDYREEVSSKKISVLKNEIAMLSKNYGEFIYIQKNPDDSFDVSFSNEPGYLLAESVAKHIKISNDFIYVERLAHSDIVLFIMMKKGKIHIDTQISIESLYDEFIVIQAEQTPFDVFLYGDLPLTNQEEEKDKIFIGNIAKSYQVLDKSVFESLARYNQFELKPINDAFLVAGIIIPTNKKTMVAIVAVIIIIILWIMWPSQKAAQVSQQIQAVTVKSEYYDYVQTLKTPEPTRQLQGLVAFLEKLETMPAGWQAQSINLSPTLIQVTLGNINNMAKLEDLHAWTSSQGIEMTISDRATLLNFTTAYPIRRDENDIYKTQETLRVIMDRLYPMLDNGTIKVSKETLIENYKEVTLTINLSNVTLNTLDLLSKQLSDLPLLFNSAYFTQSNNGLLTGSINITIVGN